MSVRRLDPNQPESFAFTPENAAWAETVIARYPEGRARSAVIPLLWRAQEQAGGWLPEAAIRHVADMLGMAPIRALEIATFYTMFQLSPVGEKAHVQVCGTTPCLLRGAEELKAVCKRRIHEHPHRRSTDGAFSWEEVECLGACVNAPMVQIGADTYEDLTPERLEKILDAFARGETPTPGPQVDRQFSAPAGGPTTLTELDYEAMARDYAARAGEAAPSAPEAHAATAGQAVASLAEASAAGAVAAAMADPPAGEDADEPANAGEGAGEGEGERASEDEGTRPVGLAAPRDGKPDDLKKISGIGPKLEGLLNELGIYHYDQIAAWNDENAAWVDNYLAFKGRIEREDWIGQAKTLAAGGETAFSARYEGGEAPAKEEAE